MSELMLLSRLAGELSKAEERVKWLEEQLANAKREASQLSEVLIPELMDKLEMESFTTSDGVEIKSEQKVFAHISRDNRAKAIAWLEENGHGNLAKRLITVEFDRDQEDQAYQLREELCKTYLDVDMKATVHPSTLRAWVKEQLREGEYVPKDLFGIEVRRVAKIG